MRKLVRDGVPEFLEGAGTHIEFSQASEDERYKLLEVKFLEEFAELMLAQSAEDCLKELADLQEVLWALAEALDIDPTAVVTQAAIKQRTRGKFDDLAIMSVELGAAARGHSQDLPVTASPAGARYKIHSDMEHLPDNYRGGVYSG